MCTSTRFHGCEECGRVVPAERRVVSNDRSGLPEVRLVVLPHTTEGTGDNLCKGTGRNVAGHGETHAAAA